MANKPEAIYVGGEGRREAVSLRQVRVTVGGEGRRETVSLRQGRHGGRQAGRQAGRRRKAVSQRQGRQAVGRGGRQGGRQAGRQAGCQEEHTSTRQGLPETIKTRPLPTDLLSHLLDMALQVPDRALRDDELRTWWCVCRGMGGVVQEGGIMWCRRGVCAGGRGIMIRGEW